MKNTVNVADVYSFLEHAGVLGMKWGRRKNKSKTPVITSKDHNSKTLLKKKRIREMSNQELKQLNDRLQLEKQYKDLTKSERTAGQKFVIDLLGSAAKQIAMSYIQKQSGELLKKAIK